MTEREKTTSVELSQSELLEIREALLKTSPGLYGLESLKNLLSKLKIKSIYGPFR